MIVTIVAFLLMLSVLVLIHEFGHFITAKKFGIKVEEFGFGFPPRVFGKKIGETLYSINLLPIGGFVKLYGEDAAGGGKASLLVSRSQYRVSSKKNKLDTEYSIQNTDLKRAFFARPIWQRAAVVLAGVFMNFVLAIVIISYLFSVPGVAVPKGYAEVVAPLPGSPAEQAQIKKGDKIVSFEGKEIKTIIELREKLAVNKDKPGKLIITRDGKEKTLTIAPEKVVEKGKAVYLIGVQLNDFEVKKYPWYQSPFYGTVEAVKFSWMILSGLGGILSNLILKGQVPSDVAGPVGVAEITGEAVKQGLVPVLWLAAVLSLNLGVVNVLPIPALDGGRLFFIGIELVTRRKVNPKYEAMAHAIGLAVLLMLILLITFLDVARVISGQSLLPKM